MKFLILNTDYPEFLRWLYARHPGLEEQPYEGQMRARVESLNSEANFYSSNLRKLGHEACDIFANNEFMQRAWAREHGLSVPNWRWHFRLRRGIVPWASRVRDQRWLYDILAAQIKDYKPDVLMSHQLWGVSVRFLREMKPYVRLLVGQHAATQFPDTWDLTGYDLVVSSFPPTVDFFREKGVPAELVRLGFEPAVLSNLGEKDETYDVTFVGSFHPTIHSSRTALLEALCARFDKMRIWGPAIDHLAPDSSICRRYVGPAWGREMYQVLRCSKVTLNHHGNVAPYANNMRLYEATGVGTLLITDWKENLPEIFEPGKEVVAYRSAEECAELIQYYLEHNDEREAIALAGQQRTLREHTYYHRMQEFAEIAKRYLL